MVDNLVRVVSARVPPFFDKEDLRQAGMVGLIQAAKRWKPKLNSSFEAYAVKRVRGAIWDLVRGRAYREATFAPIDIERNVGQLGMMHSLTSRQLRYSPAPVHPIEQEFEDSRKFDRVEAALQKLSAASARVIRAHYLEDKSLHSLQKELGVRSGRISQLHLRALEALKKELGAI